MRIATFNLQNLRLRDRDGVPMLDGAVDRGPEDAPRPVALAEADRRQTARVIAEAAADVVAVQEVFDLAALDYFHDRFLRPAGAPEYPWRFCADGNDGRGLNVAVMARDRPFSVTRHDEITGRQLGLDDLPPDLRDRPVFRRDCLEVGLPRVTLFVCHFKAPWPDPDAARIVRRAEARAVRKLIEARFADTSATRWLVLGDLNEPAEDAGNSALAVLTDGFAVDLSERTDTAGWTYELPVSHRHSRPDRMLASPALAAAFPDTRVQVIRSGMGIVESAPGREPPPAASDHALIYADFPGL